MARRGLLIGLALVACSSSTTGGKAPKNKHGDGGTGPQCAPGETMPNPVPACAHCFEVEAPDGAVLAGFGGLVVCAGDSGQWGGQYKFAAGCMCAAPSDAGPSDAESDALSDAEPPSDAGSGSDGLDDGGGG